MIAGLLQNAAVIILFIGFIYVLRGRNRSTSLSMGLLSFTVTGTLQIGSVIIGTLLLLSGVLGRFELGGGTALTSITDALIERAGQVCATAPPAWPRPIP